MCRVMYGWVSVGGDVMGADHGGICAVTHRRAAVPCLGLSGAGGRLQSCAEGSGFTDRHCAEAVNVCWTNIAVTLLSLKGRKFQPLCFSPGGALCAVWISHPCHG